MAKHKRERHERRFFPHSSANPKVIAAVGAVGALLLGAGARVQFIELRAAFDLFRFGSWMLAVGALFIGVAFWFGTSADPPIRVGDGGVGIDKGATLRRMPWYEIESLTWDSAAEAVIARGKDEATVPLTITAKLASQPHAAAWIVKEARARIPKVVEIGEDLDARFVATADSDGEIHKLDPVQVVGKHCAASDKVISFEPDARLCTRCERVYHKNHVPKKCACGAPLGTKGKPDEDAA